MKILPKIYTALVFIFLYAPIGVLILFSFNSTNSTGVFEGFSLYWYRELFSNSNALSALKNTLILATLSAVISSVIGTAAATGIVKFRRRAIKNSVLSVTNIPMMNPDIVTGISLMLLFVFIGRLLGLSNNLSFWTLLIAHITFNIPYVILNVMPKFYQMDVHLPEAAMDLGCTPLKSFFLVELPAILPGVLSGFIMAFTLSLDDFIISHFTTSGFETLPIFIYSMTKKKVKPDMYALSTLIFVAILVLLILSNVISAQGEKKNRKSK